LVTQFILRLIIYEIFFFFLTTQHCLIHRGRNISFKSKQMQIVSLILLMDILENEIY